MVFLNSKGVRPRGTSSMYYGQEFDVMVYSGGA